MNKDKLFISHILESIDLIEKYVTDVDYDNFVNAVDIQDKVLRRLEIIGEAVKIYLRK